MARDMVVPDTDYETYARRGYSPELLPQRPSERSWGAFNYTTLWMGPVHNILSYFTVVGFFQLGLSATQVMAAIMTSAVVVSVCSVLNGWAAARYGITFAMQLRDSFGVRGSLLPAMVRGFVAGSVFFGVITIASASALDVALEQVFPGYRLIGGGATFFGLNAPTAVSYLIMLVGTVALYLGGRAFLDKFAKWSAPAVYVLVCAAMVLALHNAGGIGRALAFHPVHTAVTPLAFITCVSMLVSNWAGPIVNIGDFTRNARTVRAPAIGLPAGLLVSYLLFMIVAVALMAGLSALTGHVDPSKPTIFVDAINSIGNPVVVVLLIIAMNVGATAFCVFGNMLPSGLQLTAQLPKLFSVKTGGLVAAFVGTAILPWKFVANTDALFFFYTFIGSMFGPIAGIMMASFFFERSRRLDLDDIYVAPGLPGRYPGGVNWRAVGVLIVSFIVTMSGKFLTGVPFLVTVSNLAFFSGLIIGFVGYLALSRVKTAAN